MKWLAAGIVVLLVGCVTPVEVQEAAFAIPANSFWFTFNGESGSHQSTIRFEEIELHGPAMETPVPGGGEYTILPEPEPMPVHITYIPYLFGDWNWTWAYANGTVFSHDTREAIGMVHAANGLSFSLTISDGTTRHESGIVRIPAATGYVITGEVYPFRQQGLSVTASEEMMDQYVYETKAPTGYVSLILRQRNATFAGGQDVDASVLDEARCLGSYSSSSAETMAMNVVPGEVRVIVGHTHGECQLGTSYDNTSPVQYRLAVERYANQSWNVTDTGS